MVYPHRIARMALDRIARMALDRIARMALVLGVALWILGVAEPTPAAPHLIVTTQQADVGKEIAVYEPDGTKVFSFVTEGHHDENTPTFIVADPATKTFLVACPGPVAPHPHRPARLADHDHDHDFEGHSVLIFDYSEYPGGPIVLIEELHTGWKPFHAERSPDGKFVVCNDESDTISIIDPANPDHFTTVEAGHHHTTLVFAGDAEGYDIYASRFDTPGGMDIVDGQTLTVRATLGGLIANLHTGVYSPFTKRVYFGGSGGIEVFGTRGVEKDVHLDTVHLEAGRMVPYSRISPDGRTLFGGVHSDGVAGSSFFALDLADDTLTTCTSVSCKYYAFSPDGNWLVAGDFNKPAGQTHHKVHVLDTNPQSPAFMTVVREFEVEDSRVGFQAADFSPDSRYAYLGLTTSDRLMVVDTETLTATVHDLTINAAPRFLRVLPLGPPPTAARLWTLYR